MLYFFFLNLELEKNLREEIYYRVKKSFHPSWVALKQSHCAGLWEEWRPRSRQPQAPPVPSHCLARHGYLSPLSLFLGINKDIQEQHKYQQEQTNLLKLGQKKKANIKIQKLRKAEGLPMNFCFTLAKN